MRNDDGALTILDPIGRPMPSPMGLQPECPVPAIAARVAIHPADPSGQLIARQQQPARVAVYQTRRFFDGGFGAEQAPPLRRLGIVRVRRHVGRRPTAFDGSSDLALPLAAPLFCRGAIAHVSAAASRAISASDRKRSTLRTGAFLTPRAGLSVHTRRSIANTKIALTSVTHCAATPLPPLAVLPDGRFSPSSIVWAVLPADTALRIRSTSARAMRSARSLPGSGRR